jgi:putative endonuclease
MTPRAEPGEPGETARRKSLGKAGEAVAVKHLESKGFRILATNYRRRGGEADIVARKGPLLVFCEVKTLVGSGDPREGYGFRQQRRLGAIGEVFVHEHRDSLPSEFDMRFDLIVVGRASDGSLEVKEHITDAFGPI